MPRPIRVGAVNYLNTKPLIEGLSSFAPHAELHLDLPSRLADRLAAGDLDVGLIPVIEYFRAGTYTVVPGGDPLHVDALDKNAINPANHFKDMIGWNRKAVRLMLPSAASEAQVEAVELACAVAATHFPPPTAAPAAGANAAGVKA